MSMWESCVCVCVYVCISVCMCMCMYLCVWCVCVCVLCRYICFVCMWVHFVHEVLCDAGYSNDTYEIMMTSHKTHQTVLGRKVVVVKRCVHGTWPPGGEEIEPLHHSSALQAVGEWALDASYKPASPVREAAWQTTSHGEEGGGGQREGGVGKRSEVI